jgi:hypothetical protein
LECSRLSSVHLGSSMKLFHASPYPMCHKDGIKHKVNKTCCNFDDGYVYLATKDYLREQYFKYCPNGIYYVYEVNPPKDRLEHIGHVNHYRYLGDIDPKYVEPNSVEVVKNGHNQ